MMVNCQLCKKEAYLYFRANDINRKISQESFEYYRCPSCGLIFLPQIPKDLGKYYPDNYYPIPSSRSELAKAAEFERYKIDIVKRFASRGDLLEIGPAYGSFLYLAKQAGFNAEAIEMDPNCCRFISENIGVNAIQSNDPSDALKKVGSYDVIALWHVIEHLPNPWETLAVISKKLRPGGILVIAAPNPESFQFRILGRFWPHVDAPRHLTLIPLALLSNQMLSFGLKPVWSTTADTGAFGWNTFGWMYFFTNLSSLRYLKTILGIIGNTISTCLRPIERKNGHGSAYTVIFKREEQ